ncbi:MAG: phosphoglucomutase/phosphomannomutase family protein [Candidatus Omnitrophica bacterium]|nr:phosphoglucomutase/phosphomannomutase family protein [Candidatus Omnitrophota bacterium]MBU1128635.1 phosphoglucomutase/phosphomannomutase family protein [Candidatus Omnitrophota bacterium]MBU1657029.1 phosphoglucomutase/phosphomannomutase family protein [Candidatus Omnitrophota bacterium]MBU1785016.1 phosphoglucomutase/phosphomannomutase family protein [Candidatus Omnitrophota bacterium]MBU1852235.1 phosphoglucomutase/phosphomannomutase family protein [Candidatus Omnitrophota bacterium]
MGKIEFGTDGWRAIISEDFTFENVAIVAQAIADFLRSKKDPIYRKRKIVVGYDTRFLSDKYAEITARVLAANGIKTVLSDEPCPTPAVSYYIKKYKLTGGVMITASHNPPAYNGVKYKGYFGGSAGSDIIDAIEARLYKKSVKDMPLEEAVGKGKVIVKDIISPQLDFIKKYADMKKLKKGKLKVLVDSMNGAGGTYLGEILKNTGIKVDYMYAERNPGFHGRAPEPNVKHLKELICRVKKGKYDLGVATDGDADRVAIVDARGAILTGHKVMALLLKHLVENRKMRGGVIQTVCGTGLINKMCREYGLKIYETPVGFKYICDLMYKNNILLGGEETGGIGFKNYIPERDGFLSALLMMELVISEKKPLKNIVAELNKKYGNYVYEREDVLFPRSKRKKITSGLKKNPLKKVMNKEVVELNDSDGFKFSCKDGTWLLIRLSGTEPKLRIYSETPSVKQSLKYIEFGKKYAFSVM